MKGYIVHEFSLKTRDCGVPQHRVRLYTVFLREGETRLSPAKAFARIEAATQQVGCVGDELE
eukprot:9090325-Lingulodinium_polyedra.AAC.1